MKTKEQKRNEAKKAAEALKSSRKAVRDQKKTTTVAGPQGKKGKSIVPQTKSKGK